ncbi:uncharacterized protein PHACADRAFT_257219 [Phanerochaete carnosa HHB-10118-sp]|uniref:Aminoglycoside phosphotransferase domain-containing protein n=1 Tax=Phanerochaete carnosa (strain HHB-10118-sp) TaxID=650164 RepID=K5WA90_PHACS|nr:uncharacterized protein PHACADRAFT_257219 [Phanerochaete carnosa HHB-10118-sp]EKM56140.1 hypothetical protein PHACADRAFT_257219 [Phanerochaete carnosa HHB-10118-sp]
MLQPSQYLHRPWPKHFNTIDSVRFLSWDLALKATPLGWEAEEAATLHYIRLHTTIPVPGVYAQADGHGSRYLLMDRVEGENLELAWHHLNDEQRDAIAEQLQDYVFQLRALPPMHGLRVCAVNGGALRDSRITSTGKIGPFADEAEFNDFIVPMAESFICTEILEETRRRMRDNHQVVFTHGDLAPRNILVKGSQIVAVLDWAQAGWLPEHWELVKAM